MSNEILLIIHLILLYSIVLVFYKFWGNDGLIIWTVIATIAANIEVLILVDAFGMQQTLGNIMFATTFVVTDILSEVSGKKAANKAVDVGILTALTFIVISQFWLFYTPSLQDWAMSPIKQIFSNTPRVMFAGFVVYAIVQRFDVWMYHKWWNLTTKFSHNSKKYLWIRNNASTLLSQLLNSILFTVFAFGGKYEINTLFHIIGSSYIVFIFTSLLDTPVVYLARYIKSNKK